MNVNSLITKDYRKKDDFAVRKNKPNSNPIKLEAERRSLRVSFSESSNRGPIPPPREPLPKTPDQVEGRLAGAGRAKYGLQGVIRHWQAAITVFLFIFY